MTGASMTARNMPSCGEVGHGTEAYAAEVALRMRSSASPWA